MIKQIEDVNGPVQCAVFEHHQLLNHVGHGSKWRQQQKHAQNDQKGVWYPVYEAPHGYLLINPAANFICYWTKVNTHSREISHFFFLD